jgi:hypothetical protein
MNNFSMFLVTAALLTAGAFPMMKTVSANNSSYADARRQSDGAYRDGLYLGKLDAQAGRRERPAVGRWVGEADRELFREGYRTGYAQATPMVR